MEPTKSPATPAGLAFSGQPVGDAAPSAESAEHLFAATIPRPDYLNDPDCRAFLFEIYQGLKELALNG